MREEILKILKANNTPMSELDLENILNKPLKDICDSLHDMEKMGEVYVTKKGKYMLYENTNLKVGKLSVSKKGFGFVILENEPDIHIKKENLNGAIHNDLVVAEYISEEEGRIVRILDRSIDVIVGEYSIEGDYGKIILDDDRIKLTILIDKDHAHGAISGHKVLVKPYTKIHNNKYYGDIIKILGHKDDVGIDILSKVYEHDIEPNFSDDAIKELDNIPEVVSEVDLKNRVDLRNKVTFTIDGDDAKDFDDAISIEKLSNGNYLLGVHIADVTYYVKPGTALYRDAEDRATSVYLVDRVIPMIPHKLSNGICSLNPGVDRLTMTCDMEINENGKVINYNIYESVINSKMRMTYNNVNKYLEENIIVPGYEDYISIIDLMNELSDILKKMKHKRGEINFDVSEVKIIVDEEGKPIDIIPRVQKSAEELIENFMIAANETVAEYITNVGYPMMYRIHEMPNGKKISEFLGLLKNLGHHVVVKAKPNDFKPMEMQKLLDSLSDEPDYDILCELGLRSMKKAVYSIDNLGHYGLASKCYCHFTSPIRRFPDQSVHNVLKMILHGDAVSSEDLSALSKELYRMAEHSSTKERNSIECERDVDDMKMAEYMHEHIGEVFDGVVSGVVPSGIFVRLPNLVEGRVHVSSMKGDYFVIVEELQMAIGKRTGKKYKLGDKISVKCVDTSKVDGTIDFEIYKEASDESKKK